MLSGITANSIRDWNSNRNARFDSYSIRMQTANSQFPRLRRGVFACVGWLVLLCDPIWRATPRSSEMDFH